MAPDRGRQPLLDDRGAAVRVRDVLRLRRDVPRHLHQRRHDPDRLARQLPDHDGRPGRVADLRRRRRRRARADRVGAAALRDAQAGRGRQDADVPDPHLPALHGRPDRLRPRAAARDLQRAGAVRPHRRAGDHRGDPHRARRRHGARADRPPAPPGGLRARARAAGALGAAARQPPRRRVGRDARRAAAPAPPRPRAVRRDPVLGLPGRRAVGGVPRVRRRSAARRAHPGVLRGDVRQPAADAGRRRRRRRRHDRGAGGVRGRRGAGGRGRPAVPGDDLLAAADPGRDRLLPAAQDGGALAGSSYTHYTK